MQFRRWRIFHAECALDSAEGIGEPALLLGLNGRKLFRRVGVRCIRAPLSSEQRGLLPRLHEDMTIPFMLDEPFHAVLFTLGAAATGTGEEVRRRGVHG